MLAHAEAPSRASFEGVRFEPGRRTGHVESYFLKLNDPREHDRALWIKATIFATPTEPDRPLAEGWAIAFDRRGEQRRHLAVKHVLPYAQARFSRDALAIDWRIAKTAGGGEQHLSIRARAASGRIETRGRAVSFDLRFRPTRDLDDRPMVPFFSPRMYDGPFPRSKAVTPLPDLTFEGEVDVDGDRWNVAGWRGMLGHNWGRGHAELYAWSQINVWSETPDPELVLECISARVRVGPVLTPLTTLVCVRHRGVSYDFVSPRCLLRAHGDVTTRRYGFSARSDHARIEGIVEAATEDMVGLYYPNPDGPMTYCLNTKLATARVRFEPRGRPPLVLTSRAAALEIGTRDDDHGVTMWV